MTETNWNDLIWNYGHAERMMYAASSVDTKTNSENRDKTYVALRSAIAKLESQLKAANEDAERLANKLQEYADADDVVQLSNSGTITEPYKFISDVIELHRTRLAGKEGE